MEKVTNAHIYSHLLQIYYKIYGDTYIMYNFLLFVNYFLCNYITLLKFMGKIVLKNSNYITKQLQIYIILLKSSRHYGNMMK